jgi:hypothetical protein
LKEIALKLADFEKVNKNRTRMVIFTQGANQTIVVKDGKVILKIQCTIFMIRFKLSLLFLALKRKSLMSMELVIPSLVDSCPDLFKESLLMSLLLLVTIVLMNAFAALDAPSLLSQASISLRIE